MASPASALNQATYGRYGIVTIIQRTGALAQVQTADDDATFWVRADKLKPVRVPKVRVPLAALAPTNPRPAAPAEVEPNADPFITYLRENGCTIHGKTPQHHLPKLQARYEKATGAVYPDGNKAVSVTEGGRSWTFSLHVEFAPAPSGITMPSNSYPVRKTHKRPKNLYYIPSNAFVLELLSLGFKLGRNKPVAA